MKTTFAMCAAALLAVAGCDSTQNSANNSTATPHTVNKPALDNGSATPTDAGNSDAPAFNPAKPVGSDSRLAPASTDRPGTAGPSPANTDADNTAVNERDRDGAHKTPIDQNEDQRDVNVTAEIRKAVLEVKDMSVNARNIKIITADGKVTLRGPVNSESERETIEKIARDVAGTDNVASEIEVKTE
jgi:hyperosmotically inducible protein